VLLEVVDGRDAVEPELDLLEIARRDIQGRRAVNAARLERELLLFHLPEPALTAMARDGLEGRASRLEVSGLLLDRGARQQRGRGLGRARVLGRERGVVGRSLGRPRRLLRHPSQRQQDRGHPPVERMVGEERGEQPGCLRSITALTGVDGALVLAVDALPANLRPQAVGGKRGERPVVGFERFRELLPGAVDAGDLSRGGWGEVRLRESSDQLAQVAKRGLRSVEGAVSPCEKVERFGRALVVGERLVQALERFRSLLERMAKGGLGKPVGPGHTDQAGRCFLALGIAHERLSVCLPGATGLAQLEERVTHEPGGLDGHGGVFEAWFLGQAVHIDLGQRLAALRPPPSVETGWQIDAHQGRQGAERFGRPARAKAQATEGELDLSGEDGVVLGKGLRLGVELECLNQVRFSAGRLLRIGRLFRALHEHPGQGHASRRIRDVSQPESGQLNRLFELPEPGQTLGETKASARRLGRIGSQREIAPEGTDRVFHVPFEKPRLPFDPVPLRHIGSLGQNLKAAIVVAFPEGRSGLFQGAGLVLRRQAGSDQHEGGHSDHDCAHDPRAPFFHQVTGMVPFGGPVWGKTNVKRRQDREGRLAFGCAMRNRSSSGRSSELWIRSVSCRKEPEESSSSVTSRRLRSLPPECAGSWRGAGSDPGR